MAAHTRIKICGITSIADALAAAELGADAIGLVFHPSSKRLVSVARAVDICLAVPPFVTVVGLFVDADAAAVQAVLEQVPLDLLQFHGDETQAYCSQFRRPYIKALRVRPGLDIELLAGAYHDARGILLDTWVSGVPGGTGRAFDWGLVPPGLAPRTILAGGLTPGNVAAAIAQVRPYAVDVSGGVEAAPGVKDRRKLAEFVAQVYRAGAGMGSTAGV